LVDWSDTTTSSFTLELPDLTSSVQADIEKLVVHGVTMQNLQAHAATTPEQIELTQGRVNLFGGKADGKLRWKIPEEKPSTLHFKGGLDSLQLGSFFK